MISSEDPIAKKVQKKAPVPLNSGDFCANFQSVFELTLVIMKFKWLKIVWFLHISLGPLMVNSFKVIGLNSNTTAISENENATGNCTIRLL